MNLQQIRYRLEQLKGQRQQVAADAVVAGEHIAELRQEAVHADEARAVIQAVAQATQRELEYHVSEITSLALSAVFDNPYRLVLEFVQRRNRTEADIWFERDGQRCRPIDSAGGGAVDVAALALRVAMWSLRRPRSRATLILDEPLKMLSRNLMPKAAAMIGEISRRLKLQVIMVSHAAELIEAADRYFVVEMRKGVSHVRKENGKDAAGVAGENHDYDKGRNQVQKSNGQDIHTRKQNTRPNSGRAHLKQHVMDKRDACGNETCAGRDEEADPADHDQRPQGVGTDRTPRRGRTT